MPVLAMLLSTTPSQSSSRPLQTSWIGSFGPWQTQPAAPAQASAPLWQGGVSEPLSKQPAPGGGHQVRFLNVQGFAQEAAGRSQQPFWPAGGPSARGDSSTWPLQLSSLPLQTSDWGGTAPEQTSAPLTQAVRPGLHGGWLMPQGWPVQAALL